MPEVNVDIEVWCSCGAGLCSQSEGGDGCVTVKPCESCVNAAKDEGHDEGYDEGHNEGYDKGKEESSE